MPRPTWTVDEIVEILKRSLLLNIIVEGVDDVMIYRWLEERIAISNASYFTCGGRDALLMVCKISECFKA